MKEAMFYQTLENNNVKCVLCPHKCLIRENQYGKCHVRKNEKGILYATNYGCVSALAVDPIEKKPLYHFYPGSKILSVASFGCNMSCQFCQNYELSQSRFSIETTSVEELLEQVEGMGIAFTYNEPIVWYEYVYDVAKALKEKDPNYKVVVVTNGFINPEPLKLLIPYVDAFNVDLKSFKDSFYKEICGGHLEPVLEAIKIMATRHLEITTLMVGHYISVEEVEEISEFIASIDERIPLHLSRYFPHYKMTQPATSVDVMKEACKHARRVLNHVFLGNVQGVDNNTRCSQCGETLIMRKDFQSRVMIKTNNCPQCGFDNRILGIGNK